MDDVVGNEFAEVSVRIDGEANSPRLRLEDLKTGRVRFLDALELETLVWLPDGHLSSLLDPSADRWREEPVNTDGPSEGDGGVSEHRRER